MNVYSYGTDALLVEVESTAAAVGLRERLAREPVPATIETMPGLRTVLVRFDPALTDARTVARRLIDIEVTPPDDDEPLAAAGPVPVRVAYGGPDLDEVATHACLSVDEVITAHQRATYRVVLIGMAPGFYFLAGNDPRLQPPRRRSPRTDVPRGALGLAGAYTGIYPKHGPGGWQLIGRVLDDLWHPTRLPAALLPPDAAVRFVAA